MTEAEARARISFLADAGGDPALVVADLDTLILMARRVDENGIEPGATGWIETWAINYAVAQAWLVKAGRLAGHYLFMSGGKMFARQQMFDHCMKLHAKYAMKAGIQAVRLGPGEDVPLNDIPLIGNWNANNS